MPSVTLDLLSMMVGAGFGICTGIVWGYLAGLSSAKRLSAGSTERPTKPPPRHRPPPTGSKVRTRDLYPKDRE